MTRTQEEILDDARERGAKAGHAAATWALDGNTSDATYRALVAGWEDGDPAVLNQYDWSPLSGQWAGESIPELLGDLLSELGDGREDADLDNVEQVQDAYESAALDAYWDELTRVARFHIDTEA